MLKTNSSILLLIVLIIAPIIVYSSKSFPEPDDYSNARINFVEAEGTDWLMLPAFKKTISTYLTAGGYYYAVIANFWISPFLRGGLAGIRIANCFINILFYASIGFYVYSFNSVSLKMSTRNSLIVYLLFIFCLNNIGEMNTDIYTHYVVLVGYILPLSTMFISHGLLFQSIAKKNRMYYLASMLGFLVGGSPLNIAALNCGLLLFTTLFSYIMNKRVYESAIVWTFSFVGTLINVAAPGNYVRHDMISSEYNLLESLSSTAVFTFEQLELKFTETIFPVVLIVLIYLFLSEKETIKVGFRPWVPGLLVIACFLAIVIVNFPVVFGAGVVLGRGLFVQDIATYIIAYLLCLIICGMLKEQSKGRIKWTVDIGYLFSILLVVVTCLFINIDSFMKMTTTYMIKTIRNGDLFRYAEFEEGIIEEVKQSESNVVHIYRETEITNPLMAHIDKDHNRYSNRSFGGYYGKQVYFEYGDNLE